jgi:hypothetical protein
MSRLHPLFAAVLGFALACAERDECDPATEIRIVYGSDIAGEPDGVSCEQAPAVCGDAPDCECLAGQQINGIHLDFCLDEGTCEVDDDGLVRLVCPGG